MEKKQSILDANHYYLEFYLLHIQQLCIVSWYKHSIRCQKQTTNGVDIHSQCAEIPFKKKS